MLKRKPKQRPSPATSNCPPRAAAIGRARRRATRSPTGEQPRPAAAPLHWATDPTARRRRSTAPRVAKEPQRKHQAERGQGRQPSVPHVHAGEKQREVPGDHERRGHAVVEIDGAQEIARRAVECSTAALAPLVHGEPAAKDCCCGRTAGTAAARPATQAAKSPGRSPRGVAGACDGGDCRGSNVRPHSAALACRPAYRHGRSRITRRPDHRRHRLNRPIRYAARTVGVCRAPQVAFR